MSNPAGESDGEVLRLDFDRRLMVQFRMADVAIPRTLFADILRMIAELRPPPVTSTA